MVQTIDINRTLGDIVASFPQTRQVFDELKLDYCCGGKQITRDAAEENNVSLELLKSKLHSALAKGKGHESIAQTNLLNESLTNLINHIEEKHHTFMKQKLPYDKMLLEKLEEVHGESYGEFLAPLIKTFSNLKTEIDQHLWDEEHILFPYLRKLDDYLNGHRLQAPELDFNIQRTIEQMEDEHDNAGEALRRMRELTNNYTLPEDYCQTFVVAYNDLQAIEDDLHQHVHLENSVLFPKALKAMKKVT
jgi:regulator of cell morphogenesis and NO signaling